MKQKVKTMHIRICDLNTHLATGHILAVNPEFDRNMHRDNPYAVLHYIAIPFCVDPGIFPWLFNLN